MENGGPSREAIIGAPEAAERPLFGAPETSHQYPEHPNIVSKYTLQAPESRPDASERLDPYPDQPLAPTPLEASPDTLEPTDNTADLPELQRNPEQIPKHYVKKVISVTDKLKNKPHDLTNALKGWRKQALLDMFNRLIGDDKPDNTTNLSQRTGDKAA